MAPHERDQRDDDVEDIICAFACSGAAHHVADDMLANGPVSAQAMADTIGKAAAMVASSAMAAIKRSRADREAARRGDRQ